MPTALLKVTIVSWPVPSGLKRCTAARIGSSPRLMFDCDPTERYSFEPSRLNARVRVVCPVFMPGSAMISLPGLVTRMAFTSYVNTFTDVGSATYS